MKFAKIYREGYGSYIQPLNLLKDALSGEFDGVEEYAEVGDKLTIEIIEMPEEEYDKLPEFEGW